CDEFEIEIENVRPEDVVHTYRNGNYGSPSVTLSASGASTIIDYRNPQHSTAVNTIEHFGVSLRALTATNLIRVRWLRGGHPATVNGQVPNVSGGGSTPASQPMLPQIAAEVGAGNGGDAVSCTVSNTDPAQAIWIKRRAKVSVGPVTLEALMPNNPVVTTSYELDLAPVFLAPSASITFSNDLIEIEDNQSVVFSAEYYQDVFSSGLFNQTHTVGPLLGNVMTATIASPEGSCDTLRPVIIMQPENVTADAGSDFRLRVDADGNDLPLTYQWLKEGQVISATNTLGIHGVTTDELDVDHLTAATEGFYSVRIRNDCGELVSQSALVFITGHNTAPVQVPPCQADFDASGTRDVNDIFAFLSAWFAGLPAADINSDGRDVNDIFAFLSLWFAGC
ncbi:MAG: immunoglobulin domain-containing protein, partial [Phycisphaerales bacterium]|nr:immunoglobulin domain-containing protein [Phycisphaerales bacterium]